jgi:hypothetical protein
MRPGGSITLLLAATSCCASFPWEGVSKDNSNATATQGSLLDDHGDDELLASIENWDGLDSLDLEGDFLRTFFRPLFEEALGSRFSCGMLDADLFDLDDLTDFDLSLDSAMKSGGDEEEEVGEGVSQSIDEDDVVDMTEWLERQKMHPVEDEPPRKVLSQLLEEDSEWGLDESAEEVTRESPPVSQLSRARTQVNHGACMCLVGKFHQDFCA